MNWKLLAGQLADRIDKRLLKSKSSFVHKNYPYRRNWVFDLQRRLPTPPKTIFDIGAYIGDISIELNMRFPSADIYAFEPVSKSFNELVKNIGGSLKIHPNNLALGETAGDIEIPIFGEASINTLKQAAYDNPAVASEIIKVERLDNFAKANNIEHIDILKIDVEGFELEVLRGAGDMLSKVDCIVTEVGYIRSNTKTYFTDIDNFLSEQGFELFNIYELQPLHNDRSRLFYSNNVYVKKRPSDASNILCKYVTHTVT